MRASPPSPQVRLSLWIASLLSATVLMAPAAASALAFTTSAEVDAQIRDISDPNQTTLGASLRVQAPPDQALIDISAPISLPVGGATLSALATFRSVVIPTSSGGIVSFGTAEVTTIIDPLLVTHQVVFPAGFTSFVLRFDSGDTGMNVTFSGTIHVSGAELNFIPIGLDALKVRSGGILFRPVELGEPFIANTLNQDFFLPEPADIPFAFSFVPKPNRTINFSVDAEVLFEDLENLTTNFRDSRLDFTFTATPVPGPSPLLLLVGGLAAIALIYGRMSIAKRRS